MTRCSLRVRYRRVNIAMTGFLIWAGLIVQAPASEYTNTSTNARNLPRVASINVCADQLILALAKPEQILSLTNLSLDPAASVHYDSAQDYPSNKGLVEELLPLKPDLVIAGQYTNSNTLSLLKTTNLRFEILPIPDSLDAVFENITTVARWLGRKAAGEEILASLKARLAALPEAGESPPRAAIYDPNGYTVGRNSMRGQMLELAGWRNVATERGIESYGSLPLETLLKLAPDALISSPYSAGTWSRAQALNSHPALTARGLDSKVINVPSAMTICSGPWTMDVIEELVAARKSLHGN